jgi:hypothetical protein
MIRNKQEMRTSGETRSGCGRESPDLRVAARMQQKWAATDAIVQAMARRTIRVVAKSSFLNIFLTILPLKITRKLPYLIY